MINFGEAKFSSASTTHGDALTQARRFVSVDKHYRDRVHLEKLAPAKSIDNLDNEIFGVVAAFSLNAVNPLQVFKNALDSAKDLVSSTSISVVYLVGVSYED